MYESVLLPKGGLAVLHVEEAQTTQVETPAYSLSPWMTLTETLQGVIAVMTHIAVATEATETRAIKDKDGNHKYYQ